MLYITGSLPIPPAPKDETIRPICRKVEITCESHDQGWSSYPNDKGTYRNSWTWGEVSVLIPKQDTYLHDPTVEIGDQVIEKEPKIRYRVYTNRHADSNWQIHNFVFNSDHPLVRDLQPGYMVGLWIRSQFPGWINYVKRAELKLYYSV